MHAPLKVQFGQLFLSEVGRIRHKSIYCIGLEVKSGSFGQLRRECSTALGATNGYEGAGHVSLCYVEAAYLDIAEKFVQALQGGLDGWELDLNCILVTSPTGDNLMVSL